MVAVGRRVRFAREEAGLSQADLGVRCGVHKSQISRMENGENLEISAVAYFAICEALLLDPNETWTGKKKRKLPSSPADGPTEATPIPPSSTRSRNSQPPSAKK